MSATIARNETADIDQANATGRTPVVFIHGLWLLPSSWDRWGKVFEEAGYTSLTPGWPDDPPMTISVLAWRPRSARTRPSSYTTHPPSPPPARRYSRPPPPT